MQRDRGDSLIDPARGEPQPWLYHGMTVSAADPVLTMGNGVTYSHPNQREQLGCIPASAGVQPGLLVSHVVAGSRELSAMCDSLRRQRYSRQSRQVAARACGGLVILVPTPKRVSKW